MAQQPKVEKSTPASGGYNNNNNKTVCWDCRKQGVKKGHDKCPNPGAGLFTPEKYKKKNGGSSNNNGGNNNNSNEGQNQDNWPDNDERMEDGQNFVLCCKCFNQNKKGYGVWHKSTNPKAHKTSQHKIRNKSGGRVSTATTNATDILQQISDKNPSPRTQTLMSASAMTGIPFEVSKAEAEKSKYTVPELAKAKDPPKEPTKP